MIDSAQHGNSNKSMKREVPIINSEHTVTWKLKCWRIDSEHTVTWTEKSDEDGNLAREKEAKLFQKLKRRRDNDEIETDHTWVVLVAVYPI